MKLVKLTDELILKYSKGHEITTAGDFNLKYGKKDSRTVMPIKGGVYDPEFFGSVYEGKCNCGSVRVIGKYCHRCNCEVLDTTSKLQMYAYISLPVYFITKYKVKLFVDSLQGKVHGIVSRKVGLRDKFQYLSLCNYEYDMGKDRIITSLDYDESNPPKYYSIEGLMDLLKLHFPYVYDDAKNYLNRLVIVTPAILRPINFFSMGGTKEVKIDPNSAIYQSLVYLKDFTLDRLKSNIPLVDKVMYKNYLRQYAQVATSYISDINNTSKQNLTRTILGKRVANSGRCPIVPDKDLDIDKVLIPTSLAYEMYKSDFIDYLKSKYFMTETEASTLYYEGSTEALNHFKDFIDQGKSVIINRNPTIHKYSMIGVNVGLTDDHALHLPPLLCFTGDTRFILKDESTISFDECVKDNITSCEILTKEGYSLATNIGYRKTVTVLYKVTMSDGYEFKCDESQQIYIPHLERFVPVTQINLSDQSLISSIERLSVPPTPVYCLECKEYGHFLLEGNIPVKNCSGMNADFDGDSLAFYQVPDEFRDYTMSRIGPSATFYLEKNLNPLFTPSHEFLYGLHLASLVDQKSKEVDFDTPEDMYNAYDKGDINPGDKVFVGGHHSTYGRLQISVILGEELDEVLGKDVPITAKNIITIMGKINIYQDRLERLKRLQDLSMEMMRVVGITSLSLKDLYVDIGSTFKKKLNAIVDDPNLSDTAKLVKVSDVYSDYVENEFSKNVSKKVIEMTESSDRVKMGQLQAISLPNLVISNSGDVKLAESTLYEGISPEDYKSHAVSNRNVLSIKSSSVPLSGYVTRQLTYIGQMFKFREIDQEAKEYIEIPMKYMRNRPDINGKVHNTKSDDLGKYPSCIFNRDAVIYQNQINTEQEYYDDDNIGISMSTGITESITQAGLALKHGGAFRQAVDNYKLIATQDGKVLDRTGSKLTLSYGIYYVTDKFNVISFDFKKGDVIGYVTAVMTPSFKLDCITMLIDGFSRAANRNERNHIYKSLSVTPYSGTLRYVEYDDKIDIEVDGKYVESIRKDRYTLLMLPDGSKVSEGDKITTDVLDMAKYPGSLTSRYYAFRNEFSLYFGKGKMTEEMIEFLFRLLFDMEGNGYLGVKQAMKRLPIMSRLSFGYASLHLRKIDDTELSLEGSDDYDLFTNLILGNTDEE